MKGRLPRSRRFKRVRFNSRLKGEFGGETVMVRGHKKVKLHLMFGVIAKPDSLTKGMKVYVVISNEEKGGKARVDKVSLKQQQ